MTYPAMVRCTHLIRIISKGTPLISKLTGVIERGRYHRIWKDCDRELRKVSVRTGIINRATTKGPI